MRGIVEPAAPLVVRSRAKRRPVTLDKEVYFDLYQKRRKTMRKDHKILCFIYYYTIDQFYLSSHFLSRPPVFS